MKKREGIKIMTMEETKNDNDFYILEMRMRIVILGEGGQGSVLLRGLLPRWLAAHVRLQVLGSVGP